MTVTREGIAGMKDILSKMKNPEECEPSDVDQLEHMLNGLAQEMMALGNAILQTREIRDDLKDCIQTGWYETGSTHAYAELIGAGKGIGLIDHLEKIGRAMAGSVSIEVDSRR